MAIMSGNALIWENTSMRAPLAVISCVLAPGLALAAAAPAGRLAPKDIETTFFNGQPFTAATTNGSSKFKMVFTSDNKMTREPISKGNKGDGTWRLSQDGFCSTWKGGRENCFRVQPNGTNRWSVIAGTMAVAYWSK
jgi:hypothetical protein